MLLLTPGSTKPLRIYSDGSGTQSIAVMVLQAQGKLPNPYDFFVFANVGEDSENADTLAYRQEYVLPFALKHGIPIIERWLVQKGERQTVYQKAVAPDKSLPIPVKFPGQGFGNRKCTVDFKVEVVNRFIRTELQPTHCVVGIGFSAEEGGRIYGKYSGWHDVNWSRDKKTKQWKPGKKLGFWRNYEFPLAQLGMRRAECQSVIQAAGLPPAPSSICWFCPFTPRGVWIERKRNRDTDPTFNQAVEMERLINEKYHRMCSTHPKASKFVGLHRDGIPLEQVGDQLSMYDIYQDVDESCEIGVCGV